MKSDLRGNSLGVAHVVFFVIATAAPLAALVGVSPAAIAFGNGIGVPGSFVVTGLLYVLFSVGYTAMSRHVRNTGAFYALISQGLGGIWGVAAAFVAVLAYGGVQLAVYTLLGLFLSAAVEQHTGSNISWWVFTLGAVVVVHILAQRSVIFSGRVLSALLMAEILIISVLDIVIVAHGLRQGHLSFAGFHPQIVFSAGFGASLAFVVPSYLGFEASTIFAEEARSPAKTIPRATYIAVVLITALYALSEWAVIQAHDPGTVVEAARRDPATFYFAVSSQYLGAWATNMMNLLLWTSLLAAALSLQTTLSRYLFALGRERVIWSSLAATHPQHQSPYIAGRAVTFAVTAIVCVCAITRIDPYATVFACSTTVAAIAILLVQALVGVAIVAFFSSKHGAENVWVRLVAPLASSLGLSCCIVAILFNLETIAGTSASMAWVFPTVVLVAFSGGMFRAITLRRHDPDRYVSLGRTVDP